MRIYHIATEADWRRARQTGVYRTSTYGRTLAQDGFIHASRREQVALVLDLGYADVTEPLVLLEIETDLLDVPWREDPVEDDTFPHIYGPLATRAVVGWRPARAYDVAAGHSVPPTPVLTTAFRTVAFILGCATVTLLILALIARNDVNEGTQLHVLEFLMWSFFVTSGVCTIASLGAAEYVRQSSGPTPAHVHPGAQA